jgi:transposase InsO family protein
VFAELEPLLGIKPGCELVGKSRATLYRRRNPVPPVAGPPRPPAPHPASLSTAERGVVLEVLRSPRFVDKAPAQVWATLLDEGRYLCSISTMYRLLRREGEVRERRAQATHPAKVRPELVATAPNRVWSWDITKLKGPHRGVYYDLFVMLDIYSRVVVHWMIATAETAELARGFITDAIAANGGIAPVVVHADRGTSMTSKNVATLLADLGVTRSHSRPHVSNDNPYSEAQLPGSGQGSHLPAPTDPDVNLSAHPARAVRSFSQYRSAQCANSRGATSRTSFSHSRARLPLRSSRLYFLRAQRIRWRSMRWQSGITLLG